MNMLDLNAQPATRTVMRALAQAENDACLVPEDSREYRTGPWDEYFSAHVERWPKGYRWIACFVVVGGSEGLYLHVEAIFGDGRRELLILGKTCASSREAWDRCYASAGRIAWLLNNDCLPTGAQSASVSSYQQ